MKALSIKQPWASLIAHGIKDIENRTWKTNFRGRIYIHASTEFIYWKKCLSLNLAHHLKDNHYNLLGDIITKNIAAIPTSSIIGEVDIVDCVVEHPSIWAEVSRGFPSDPKVIYNWVMANPVLYDEPILNVKGKLSFWEFEPKNQLS